jgi:peroxiredoxin family protein
MANGARAEGIEANLFFTFSGLDAISRKRHGLTKDDLIDQIQGIITVGDFYSLAAGGQIIFT